MEGMRLMQPRIGTGELRGIFNILPTPTVKHGSLLDLDDTVDYHETRHNVRVLVDGGVDGVLTNGTFGEAPTLTERELYGFNECVVKEVAGAVPVFAGATAMNTRDTISRARTLVDIGANGVFLGRPMWCESDDATILHYYSDVAEALPGTPIIAYDNPEAFKGKISPSLYRSLAQIPTIIGAKYVGISGQYLADVEACGDQLVIMPVETDWYYARRWVGERAPAVWSGSGNCGMGPLVALREAVAGHDDAAAERLTAEMREANATLFPRGNFKDFSRYNIPLEKARFAAAGLVNPGRPRPPYDQVPEEFLRGAQEAGRRWAALQLKYGQLTPATAAPGPTGNSSKGAN